MTRAIVDVAGGAIPLAVVFAIAAALAAANNRKGWWSE